MKVKEIAEKYNLDMYEFDRFIMIKKIPCKQTFSGTVIEDKDVEKYVAEYHEWENSMTQKIASATKEQRDKREKFRNKLQYLFTIKGCRGRILTVCKNKCIIETDVTIGSVLTDNATDGEKIIFFNHCSSIQFKEAGLMLGYLQFETPSMQMNNQASNFFSENTFTFEEKHGLTNSIMREVFYYVMELIENCSSGAQADAPEFPPLLKEYLNARK